MKVILYPSDTMRNSKQYEDVDEVYVSISRTVKWNDGERDLEYQLFKVDMRFDNDGSIILDNVYDLEIL